MPSPYQQQLDERVWSFSSVSKYDECPKAFYRTYIEHTPQRENAFAQWGSLGHSILERYYRGELDLWDLEDTYLEEYDDAVTEPFPFRMADSYFKAGDEYFSNFEGDFQGCEIVGIEQEIQIEIEGYKYIGYIDLLVRDDKGYIICDHKSKAGFKTAEEKHHYLRQLYLYALYVREQYGEYPYKLIFNMFRKGIWVEEQFDETACMEAKEWFVNTIKRIYEDESFKDKIAIEYKAQGKLLQDFPKQDFYCNYLCDVPCLRSRRFETFPYWELWKNRGEDT